MQTTTKQKVLTESAGKVLTVADALFPHFAQGLSPGEISRATGIEPSSVTRYVATLEAQGWAERIPETGRIRPSARLARHALSVASSLDAARRRIDELAARVAPGGV